MTRGGGWFESLIRRKRVDSGRTRPQAQQLAKKLSALDLVAIGNSISSSFSFQLSMIVCVIASVIPGISIIPLLQLLRMPFVEWTEKFIKKWRLLSRVAHWSYTGFITRKFFWSFANQG